MANNYKYTAGDFERYHSGKMSEAEMNAIEKAALADPFLADALEGYAYTGSPATDIKELNERLSTKRKKEKAFPWLRIAAMFILIAGMGYLAYQLNLTEEDGQLATKQADEKNINKQIEALKTDSPFIKKEVVINTPTENGNKLITKENKLPAPAITKSNDEAVETPSEFQLDQTSPKPAAPDVQKDIAFRPEKKFTEKKVEAVTQSDSQNLQEVVVTAHGITRSEKSIGYVTRKNKQAPKEEIADSASQPVNGWQPFTEYIQKNIKMPMDDSGKNYKGKIVLSFEINKRGRTKDIKVDQSLCKPCDEEAIRLLKQGPKWKYTDDKRRAVTIEF